MANKKVRVLREVELKGKLYQPNSVLIIDEKLAANLAGEGSVDTSAEAVKYCEQELRAKAEAPGGLATEAA